MKKNILIMILGIAIFATGCLSDASPMSKELDSDGSFLLIAKYKHALDSFNSSMNILAESILDSSLSEPVRNKIVARLQLYTLIFPLAGIEEDFTIGASSVELPVKMDKKVIFRNNVIIEANSIRENRGLWPFLGKSRDLSKKIEGLPASTVFAVNLDLNPKVVADFINLLTETLDEEESFFNKATLNALRDVKGEFSLTIVALPPVTEDSKKYPWGGAISIDDPDKHAYKAVANLLGYPNVGNELFMTNLIKGISKNNPMVLIHKDGKTLLYSSKESRVAFEENRTFLVADRNYDVLMQGLSTQGVGFVFIEPRFQNFYNLMLRFFKINTLAKPSPLTMAIIQKDSNIKITANSTWDINSTYIQTLLNSFRDFLSRDIAMQHQQHLAEAHLNKAIDSSLDTLSEISSLLKSRGENQESEELERKIRDVIAKNSQQKFVFFGLPDVQSDPNLPVVVDDITSHNNFFNVVLNSGKIETFSVTKLDSYKRLISFLHSQFKYKEGDFMRLIKKATEIDNEKQK